MGGERDSSEFDSELAVISRNAVIEFMNVSDFLWKSPSFINDQVVKETEKLDGYYPLSGNRIKDENARLGREGRWKLESRALFGTFPFMLSTGNLIACLSILESHLERLCTLADGHFCASFEKARGIGISKMFKYLDQCLGERGKQLEQLTYYPPIRAAYDIRNSFTHARGILLWSRQRERLVEIVSSKLYLTESDREREVSENDDEHKVIITSGLQGEQLKIGHYYVWKSANYAQSLVQELCVALR